MQAQIGVNKTQLITSSQPKGGALPLGIKNFLSIYSGSKKSSSFKYENTGVKWATPTDIHEIIKLHETVYEGNYPYHEMLDSNYLTNFTSDINNGVAGLYSSIEHNKVGGCGIMMVDSESRSGYMRGLMIDPKYLGVIDAKKGALETVRFGYEKYAEQVDRWYTETRTAHNKAQFLMECIGCRPCAIFPNKDIFFGGDERECDILDVSYFDETLYIKRNQKPELLWEFESLYNLIADRYLLPSCRFDEPYIKFDFDFMNEAQNISENISVTKKGKEFNVDHYELKTEKGSSMTFITTKTIDCAEKTEIIAKSPEELAGLLIKFEEVMEENIIEYFEYYLPATNTVFQKIFMEFNFSVYGYVPAWSKNDNGSLDDCIIVGKYKKDIEFEKINLTKHGKELLDIVKIFLY